MFFFLFAINFAPISARKREIRQWQMCDQEYGQAGQTLYNKYLTARSRQLDKCLDGGTGTLGIDWAVIKGVFTTLESFKWVIFEDITALGQLSASTNAPVVLWRTRHQKRNFTKEPLL